MPKITALDSVREGGQQWSATFECWDFQTGHLAEVDIFCGQFITTSAKVTPNGGLVNCLDIFTCRFRKKITRCLFPPWFLDLDGFFGVWDKKNGMFPPIFLLPVWGRNCTRKKVDSNVFWNFWDYQLFGNRCAGYLRP